MRNHPFCFRPIKRGVGAPGPKSDGQRERENESGSWSASERERERASEQRRARDIEKERGKVLATHFHVSHGVLWNRAEPTPPSLEITALCRTLDSDWVLVRGKGSALWTWGRSFLVKDIWPPHPHKSTHWYIFPATVCVCVCVCECLSCGHSSMCNFYMGIHTHVFTFASNKQNVSTNPRTRIYGYIYIYLYIFVCIGGGYKFIPFVCNWHLVSAFNSPNGAPQCFAKDCS